MSRVKHLKEELCHSLQISENSERVHSSRSSGSESESDYVRIDTPSLQSYTTLTSDNAEAESKLKVRCWWLLSNVWFVNSNLVASKWEKLKALSKLDKEHIAQLEAKIEEQRRELGARIATISEVHELASYPCR